MIVNVAGLSNAFKMDFEEVLVKADVMYQVIHRACTSLVRAACSASLVTYYEFVGDRCLERLR